jgi:hypothetical protein
VILRISIPSADTLQKAIIPFRSCSFVYNLLQYPRAEEPQEFVLCKSTITFLTPESSSRPRVCFAASSICSYFLYSGRSRASTVSRVQEEAEVPAVHGPDGPPLAGIGQVKEVALS